MRFRPRIDRLSWRLGISIALLVVGSLGAASILFYQRYYAQVIDNTRRSAAREAWLIRQALEAQMVSKDRGRIQRLVSEFVKQPPVQRVMVIDREGEVRFSSDPEIGPAHFELRSPTCQVCHRLPPAKRQHTTIVELSGGEILRSVQPIPNRAACHGCHEPEHRMNGVIIVDLRLEPTRGDVERSVRQLALGTGTFALLLLAGIVLAMRRLVLRRLYRFETAARAIAEGDYERRVPVTGDDALTRVEQQFNQMADSVTGLLGELQQQQASLLRVMNSVDDGMVVLDRQRRIVAANDAFTRRFPARKSLVGSSCCAEAGDQRIGGFACGCRGDCPTLGCFDSGRVQMAVRTRVLAGGSTRQEEVRCSPVHAADGTITHVVEIWRDITDRRSAEAQFADYERMVSLGMLASAFSHELNTPLASIGTCLEGIARSAADSDQCSVPQHLAEIGEYTRIALTQVERCANITEQFLQLARGDSLARDIIDLPSCAEVVLRLCEHPAQKRGVQLTVVRDTDPPAVLANASSVQQVLLNLVLNAIHACEAEDTITLAFADSPKEVAILVRDTGRGMSAEELSRVFEPFFTRRAKGSGLGLFVSMNLARAWGGDIRVESTAGEGTTFKVIFPRLDTQQKAAGDALENPPR